jgi:hypothetical protein
MLAASHAVREGLRAPSAVTTLDAVIGGHPVHLLFEGLAKELPHAFHAIAHHGWADAVTDDLEETGLFTGSV